MKRVLLGLSSFFALATAACSVGIAFEWPQFRGPHGDGTVEAARLPTHWAAGEITGAIPLALSGPTLAARSTSPIAWQAEIPGRGWSSPVVVGQRVWLTTAEQLALTERQREERLSAGVYRDFAEQFQAHASVTLYAVEVDLRTGKLLRTVQLFTYDNPPPIHATNTYASPTPVADGECLYCHFGPLGTVAVDMRTGRVIWRRQFQFDDITGPGSSPALWADRLILPCDGVDRQFVVALEKATGEISWQTARPPIAASDGKLRRAFSTPLVIEHQGHHQAIVPAAEWVVAYDPRTGAERWRVHYGEGQHAIVPRPVYRDGVAYVCTGFTRPQLWAIRVDGTGDVTSTHVVWKYDRQVPEISSPVLAGNEIYFVSSIGVATCLDAKTGELVWQQRIGGNHAASPLAADGKLYFTSREGVTTVLKAGREYREVARNQHFGQTLASLAVAGRWLLIRADRMLYCVGAPGGGE